MPDRKTKFSDALQKKFKEDFEACENEYLAVCKICGSRHDVSYGSASLLKHLDSQTHKDAVKNAQKTPKITNYFSSREETDLQSAKMSASEVTFAYHSAKHHQSARTVDCQSKMISSIFEPKFSCGKTKNSALVKNVSMMFEYLDSFPVSFLYCFGRTYTKKYSIFVISGDFTDDY